jgi:DNA-binding NtrC family response regulator
MKRCVQCLNHEWKGEVRELENIIERAVIFCKGDMITLQELPATFKPKTDEPGFFMLMRFA